MTAEIIPFGAIPVFQIATEIRFMACHYGVRPRAVRSARRTTQTATLARHALMWRLYTQKEFSASTIARWLHCSPKAVREGVRLHERRITEWREAAGIAA
ncbi:MAG TPA: hypothetical protein VG735_07910 [Caulobacterales bacterium]|nr:hypothetical protein [Caulobacterales bacterium]